MRRFNLISATKWDELELLRAEAGRVFSDPSDDNWDRYHRLSNSVPEIETVHIAAGRDWFTVTPASGQPHNQLAYGTLYRVTQGLGWCISTKLVERFDPSLAFHLGRRYGLARLGYKSSWRKVTMPAKLLVREAEQRHPGSVGFILEAVRDLDSVMSFTTFRSLSARSIARTLSPGEASQYLEAFGER